MKTRINKFMSLLLAMVMLISMITVVNVSAATVGGLTLKTSGTAAVAESTEQVYSGDKSIKFTSVSTSGDDIWYGENAELGVTRGNKYSVEMYIYPITSTGKVTVSLDGGTRVDVTYDGTTLNVSNKTNWSATQADKSGWWKVATNGAIEVASHATNTTWKPQFMIGRGFQCYVDSIKITPENSTTPVFSANFDTPKIDISEMEEGAVTELYNTTSVDSKVGYATDETGNRLLKIDAKAGGGVWLGDPVEDFGMQAHSGDSKPGYGIAFDIYIDNWTGGKLWLKPAPNNNNTYSTVYYASLNYSAEKGLYLDDTNKGRWKITALTGEKAGWYRVENTTAICSEKGFASVNGYGRGYMWYVPADNTGDISVCVDNIELYNWTDGYTGQNTGSITGDPIKVIDFETVAIDYDARVDYMPKNFMAVQSGLTQMNIAWRNPAAPAVSSVKLYDITNPKAATEIVPATAFSTDADAINKVYHENISSGTTYVYRLDFTFADGTVKSYTTGCTAGDGTYSYKSGSYTLTAAGSSNKAAARLELDDNIYGTAAPSIHVITNATTFDAADSRVVLMLYPNTPIKKDTNYEVNLKIKGNKMHYVQSRGLGYDNNTYMIANFSWGGWGLGKLKTQEDWFPSTRTVVANKSDCSVFTFTFPGSVEDFWIDDAEIYELDANGARVDGVNILASIGAVDNAQARPADLATVTATPEAFGTKLSWTAGEGQEYVAVYDKAMSEYNPVAYVPASLGEVTISNLEEGETYDYIVKTVNAEGRESENGTEVQALAGGEELIVTYYVPAKNFIVTQVSGTQISVSWRNPKAVSGMVSTITKAELYDADTNALIYEGTDMTANAISEYLDTDFTAGTPKNYRLDLTYSDGVVKSQVAGIVPASAGYSYGAGSWQVISSASVKPSAEMSVDDDVYRTAAPSIHIVSNNTAGLDKKELRLKLVSNTTLDTTKTYRVEGYAKMNKTGYVFEFMLGNTSRSYMIHDKWTQFLT
ncbi:MAG: hypothetical protein U0M60_10815, partial [Clostridia bacterium]|nr:hypothetical protein [Clostridia bacterium]